MRTELQEEIARTFAAGPLRREIETLIAGEVERRASQEALIAEVVRAVETRMRERRVQRVRDRSTVVRDGGEHFNARTVVADTLAFVDVAETKREEP